MVSNKKLQKMTIMSYGYGRLLEHDLEKYALKKTVSKNYRTFILRFK